MQQTPARSLSNFHTRKARFQELYFSNFEISDLGPRPSDLGPRTSDLGPRTSDLGPPTSDLGPRTSDLGGQAPWRRGACATLRSWVGRRAAVGWLARPLAWRALDLTESYVPSIRAACAGAGLGRVCVPGAPTPLAAMIKHTRRPWSS